MRHIKAAVLHEQPGKWQVEQVELDDVPRHGEVLVKLAYAGLCHSDQHSATGDIPMSLPFNGGHEGSGVVEAVGPGVSGLEVGDHIVTSFIPSCGQCRWCAVGMQNLCDRGGEIMSGRKTDGTCRMFLNGQEVTQSGVLGTFAEYGIFPIEACIKISKDIPLASAALTACGVPTGWGSAVNAAEVTPGDVVVVIGIGGIGANALQGAKHCGASRVIAVDLVEGKREAAHLFGATDFTTDVDEAIGLARSLTNGQGADAAIVTIGEVAPGPIGKAFEAIRKAGVVVITSQGSLKAEGIPVNLFEVSMFQKRIQGALYGMSSPRRSVPRLLQMYQEGQLLLDELITKTYSLEEINEGYADMQAGRNIRGVLALG